MRREREAWAGHWLRRFWSWEVNRKRGRLVAAAAVVLSVPLGGARCAPAGGWHPQLPVMSRIEWMNQEPLDKPIRFGPKPAYGEWIQLGWTHVGRRGRLPVWQQIGARLTGGEAG